MTITLTFVFAVLGLVCFFLKFVGVTIGGTNNGKPWGLDLMAGGLLFWFIVFCLTVAKVF